MYKGSVQALSNDPFLCSNEKRWARRTRVFAKTYGDPEASTSRLVKPSALSTRREILCIFQIHSQTPITPSICSTSRRDSNPACPGRFFGPQETPTQIKRSRQLHKDFRTRITRCHSLTHAHSHEIFPRILPFRHLIRLRLQGVFGRGSEPAGWQFPTFHPAIVLRWCPHGPINYSLGRGISTSLSIES